MHKATSSLFAIVDVYMCLFSIVAYVSIVYLYRVEIVVGVSYSSYGVEVVYSAVHRLKVWFVGLFHPYGVALYCIAISSNQA